jgi:hypothetical protein
MHCPFAFAPVHPDSCESLSSLIVSAFAYEICCERSKPRERWVGLAALYWAPNFGQAAKNNASFLRITLYFQPGLLLTVENKLILVILFYH